MTAFNMTILDAAPAAQTGNSGMGFWIMIIAIFVIMYFFMIRPQNKKQKEIQKFRNSLAVGDHVVTAGGIHGTIRSISETDSTLQLEVATGVKLQVERSSIYADAMAAQQSASK